MVRTGSRSNSIEQPQQLRKPEPLQKKPARHPASEKSLRMCRPRRRRVAGRIYVEKWTWLFVPTKGTSGILIQSFLAESGKPIFRKHRDLQNREQASIG